MGSTNVSSFINSIIKMTDELGVVQRYTQPFCVEWVRLL